MPAVRPADLIAVLLVALGVVLALPVTDYLPIEWLPAVPADPTAASGRIVLVDGPRWPAILSRYAGVALIIVTLVWAFVRRRHHRAD